MKYQYQDLNLRKSTLTVIAKANEIIDEYMAEGYELTLRQLYYQFVARGLSENREREYKRLGSVLSDGRLAGKIDWNAIVDRTRQIKENSHWEDPSEILQSATDSYALDTRKGQSTYIEVWVEKEALAGVLERACKPLDVSYFSCKGYVSQSAMWRAARRIIRQDSDKAIILYLGDCDPSGVDMSRDIQDRLELFAADCCVERIALNFDQIDEYNPPPNPAKVTDSRYANYIEEFGNESWELDALDPRIINDLITKKVNSLTDIKKRKALIQQQESQREKLQAIADNFDDLETE